MADVDSVSLSSHNSIKKSKGFEDLLNRQMKTGTDERPPVYKSSQNGSIRNGDLNGVNGLTSGRISQGSIHNSDKNTDNGVSYRSLSRGSKISEPVLDSSSVNMRHDTRGSVTEHVKRRSYSSEQELSQYFPGTRQSPSVEQYTPKRPDSASSYSYNRQTPEAPVLNSFNSQPSLRSPLVTTRRTPLSLSTRSSSRTNGHGSSERASERGGNDLEQTVTSLREKLNENNEEYERLLSDVGELKAENTFLKQELEDERKRNGFEPQSYDDRFRNLLTEKENLNTEVYKLRDKLARAEKANSKGSGDNEPFERPSSITSFDPNNSHVLQRRIDDLVGQIQDLQEANEIASEELKKADEKISELNQENDSLQTASNLSVEDLQRENQYLRKQIDQLNDSRMSYQSDADRRLRDELQQLRQDMRTLRDRNNHINEENLRLRSQLQDQKFRTEMREKRMTNGHAPKYDKKDDFDNYQNHNDSLISGELDDLKFDSKPYSTSHYSKPDQYGVNDTSYSSAYKYSPPVKADHSISIGKLDDVNLSSSPYRTSSRYDSRSPSKHPSFNDSLNKHYHRDEDSDTSDFLDEVERELQIINGGHHHHRRGKSSDHYNGSRHRDLSPLQSPRAVSPEHFRSVSPPPAIVTQHNKHIFGPPKTEESFSTVDKHPFAPRSAADINMGNIVKFSRQNGRISRGIVRYVGHLPGRNDSYIGIELEREDGKHDGTYNGHRYFTCKPNKGVFVAFNKVVMAWSSV